MSNIIKTFVWSCHYLFVAHYNAFLKLRILLSSYYTSSEQLYYSVTLSLHKSFNSIFARIASKMKSCFERISNGAGNTLKKTKVCSFNLLLCAASAACSISLSIDSFEHLLKRFFELNLLWKFKHTHMICMQYKFVHMLETCTVISPDRQSLQWHQRRVMVLCSKEINILQCFHR